MSWATLARALLQRSPALKHVDLAAAMILWSRIPGKVIDRFDEVGAKRSRRLLFAAPRCN